MNKKEFIKALEQKLSILDEEEVKDIVNEYKDTIDEKVKHGKTEEEAVADFGSIDELTKEILKAYKINPKYGDKKDNAKEVIDDVESLIKKGAKKMAEFSKKVVEDFKNSGNNLSVELIFEIIIKAIILLILCAFLHLPFEFINFLVRQILDITFYPLDKILMLIWEILLFILYFISCILLFIAMFKQYINTSKVEVKETKSKTPKKKEVNKEDHLEESKVVYREKVVVKESAGSVIAKILKVLGQIFIVIFCLVPLWFITFVTLVVLILSVYYLCIGLNTVGVLLGSIGLLILFSYTSNIFHSIAFNHKKVYFFPFILSLVFVVLGVLLTIDMVSRVEYIEDVPKNTFDLTTDKYEFTIEKPTYIESYKEKEYIVDKSLEDNKVIINVSYYDELENVTYDRDIYDNMEQEFISFYTYGVNEYNNGWKIYNLVIDNLKDNKIYNYDLLYGYEITVYANEETMKLLKKD